MNRRPLIPRYHFTMHYGFAAFIIMSAAGLALWLGVSLYQVAYEIGYWERDHEIRTVARDVKNKKTGWSIAGAGADVPAKKGR